MYRRNKEKLRLLLFTVKVFNLNALVTCNRYFMYGSEHINGRKRNIHRIDVPLYVCRKLYVYKE